MTYQDLYIKCLADAKVLYPNSEFINDYDCIYNMSHLDVHEIFEPLDLLVTENEYNIKWTDDILYMHGTDYTELLYNDMMEYFALCKDREV